MSLLPCRRIPTLIKLFHDVEHSHYIRGTKSKNVFLFHGYNDCIVINPLILFKSENRPLPMPQYLSMQFSVVLCSFLMFSGIIGSLRGRIVDLVLVLTPIPHDAVH